MTSVCAYLNSQQTIEVVSFGTDNKLFSRTAVDMNGSFHIFSSFIVKKAKIKSQKLLGFKEDRKGHQWGVLYFWPHREDYLSCSLQPNACMVGMSADQAEPKVFCWKHSLLLNRYAHICSISLLYLYFSFWAQLNFYISLI